MNSATVHPPTHPQFRARRARRAALFGFFFGLSFSLLLAALLLWIPLDRADALKLGFIPLLFLIVATYLLSPWLVRRRYS